MCFFFQATLTLSEDDSTGNSIPSAWTLWRATRATSAWIFSAVGTCECLNVDNQTNRFISFVTLTRRFWSRETFVCSSCGFEGDETISSESVYALLHLLNSTFFSGKPRYVSSDLCSYTRIYFAHFVTIRLRSGPCINDVWCCVDLTFLSLSLKLRFWTVFVLSSWVFEEWHQT